MNTQMAEVMQNDVAAMKYCRDCPEGDQWHPATNEFFYSSRRRRSPGYIGKIELSTLCKKCHNIACGKRSAIRKKKAHVKETNVSVLKPPRGTPEQCGSCNTTTGNILGDVDIATAHRYGYLCTKCYKLARDFQSDAERLRKVLEYIENTR